MKRIKILYVILLLSCTLEASGKPVHETQPDSRDITLWVILCTEKVEELDEIFNEIKMFTEHMNGESNCLTIHLFRSKTDLENCRILETKNI